MAIARRENGLQQELRTLLQSSYVNLYHARWQASLEDSCRALEVVTHSADPHAESNAHFLAATALYILGEREQAGVHANAGLAPFQGTSIINTSAARICYFVHPDGHYHIANPNTRAALGSTTRGNGVN